MMVDQENNTQPQVMPGPILNGLSEYETAIDIVIAQARRELLIFDADLVQGGYGGLKRCEALSRFLSSSRAARLTIIVHDTTYITRQCPRLINVLKLYSHAMTICRTDEQAQNVSDSFIIADRVHYLHRFHRDSTRFRFELEAEAAARPLYEKFTTLQEISQPAVQATTLGL